MNYTTAIETLETKRGGYGYTIADWKRIAEKAAATLTDDDLTVIGYFGGDRDAGDVSFTNLPAWARFSRFSKELWMNPSQGVASLNGSATGCTCPFTGVAA
jgi:hypothetical protein